MSKILLSLVTIVCLLKAQAQPKSGYSIHLHLKPYTGGKVYLGYYYGKVKALADSSILNANGEGLFDGKERLPGGVYFVVSPGRTILFEMLLDSSQHFTVSADTTNLTGSLSFTGSPDVGWELKKQAGKKKVILELGGNAGVIVSNTKNMDELIKKKYGRRVFL